MHNSTNSLPDSIYTERYMHTPQNNPSGYDNASISDVQSLGKNVRFLVMHGVSDDNVHMQNTLTLLDKLDLASVENYDVHVFPDSDHSIYFHNANKIVYDSKSNIFLNDMSMRKYSQGSFDLVANSRVRTQFVAYQCV
jgi:dipeptidyl aminopeptidase